MLDKVLSHTLEHQDTYDEIILVDNGSTDGTPEFVEHKFPTINVVKLSCNLGVPGARNLGALTAKHNLLLFIDDDAYYDFSSIDILRKAFGRFPDVAAIGGKVLNAGKQGTFRADFEVYRSKVSRFRYALSFHGGVCLIRRDRLIEVGMLPEHFFYCGEEWDLSYRLIKAGYKILEHNNTILLHWNLPKYRKENPKFFFYYFRNRHFRVWRNLPLSCCLIESIYVIFTGPWRARCPSNIRAFLKGTLSAFLKLPEVIMFERQPMALRQYLGYRWLNHREVDLS